MRPQPITREEASEIVALRGTEPAWKIGARYGLTRHKVWQIWREQRQADQDSVRGDRPSTSSIIGLHGVSVPRLRFLEDAR